MIWVKNSVLIAVSNWIKTALTGSSSKSQSSSASRHLARPLALWVGGARTMSLKGERFSDCTAWLQSSIVSEMMPSWPSCCQLSCWAITTQGSYGIPSTGKPTATMIQVGTIKKPTNVISLDSPYSNFSLHFFQVDAFLSTYSVIETSSESDQSWCLWRASNNFRKWLSSPSGSIFSTYWARSSGI